MKIAIICSTFLPSHDGVSITLFERLKKLSETGHSALCLVSSYSEVEDIYPNWSDYIGCIFDNVEIVSLPSKPWIGVKQERNPTQKSISIIENALKDFQPDIIQVEELERLWTTMFTVPGLSYAKRHDIPCIGSYRTNFIDYIEDYMPWWTEKLGKLILLLLTRWIYNQCSITLVGSHFIAQRLKLWGIDNVSYAPVIGPSSVEHPETMKCSHFFQDYCGLSGIDDTVKILFLGRLFPDKNWQFSCKYLPKLIEQLGVEKFTIIIAGRGELEDSIRSSFLNQNLSPVMLGEVPHDKVSHLLANVDIHVTSSLRETFGRTVQESLYVGTPVLAPDCDWTRNLIKPNFNGVLYQQENGEDFVEKLTKLINQPKLLTKLRRNILLNNSQNTQKNDPASKWIEYLCSIINISETS